MFDALKGLKEAILVKEKQPEQKRILAEDAAQELNEALIALQKGQLITAVYYCGFEQVHKQITGKVSKVDAYWQQLQIDNISIDFSEITELYPS